MMSVASVIFSYLSLLNFCYIVALLLFLYVFCEISIKAATTTEQRTAATTSAKVFILLGLFFQGMLLLN